MMLEIKHTWTCDICGRTKQGTCSDLRQGYVTDDCLPCGWQWVRQRIKAGYADGPPKLVCPKHVVAIDPEEAAAPDVAAAPIAQMPIDPNAVHRAISAFLEAAVDNSHGVGKQCINYLFPGGWAYDTLLAYAETIKPAWVADLEADDAKATTKQEPQLARETDDGEANAIPPVVGSCEYNEADDAKHTSHIQATLDDNKC